MQTLFLTDDIADDQRDLTWTREIHSVINRSRKPSFLMVESVMRPPLSKNEINQLGRQLRSILLI